MSLYNLITILKSRLNSDRIRIQSNIFKIPVICSYCGHTGLLKPHFMKYEFKLCDYTIFKIIGDVVPVCVACCRKASIYNLEKCKICKSYGDFRYQVCPDCRRFKEYCVFEDSNEHFVAL
ncbi:hypothetical protein EDEG_02974 [Edhazardia aedis USNM 41457]|uniref:Uncharacterized protein n=1 Tax=Edhazardia aedis (strain USNM 41457) TaxID=1003232 RepID=J9DMR7_EDHAE|nr:hypothetical protein EDEG_02974 [Edhazardia aedis USNM 41457]|eukprot:EJW02632.1 hypothetical protein EDEG_02974 [Edhazardia aedis USNM 41457]